MEEELFKSRFNNFIRFNLYNTMALTNQPNFNIEPMSFKQSGMILGLLKTQCIDEEDYEAKAREIKTANLRIDISSKIIKRLLNNESYEDLLK